MAPLLAMIAVLGLRAPGAAQLRPGPWLGGGLEPLMDNVLLPGLDLCSVASGGVVLTIWRFPKMGGPPNGWFILENPIKKDQG